MTLRSRRRIPDFLLLIAVRNRLLEFSVRVWSPRVGTVLVSCSPNRPKLANAIVWGTSSDPFILVLWFAWNAPQCPASCTSRTWMLEATMPPTCLLNSASRVRVWVLHLSSEALNQVRKEIQYLIRSMPRCCRVRHFPHKRWYLSHFL